MKKGIFVTFQPCGIAMPEARTMVIPYSTVCIQSAAKKR
jgi:RNA polymerase-binding transcription factor DksA